MLFPLYLSDLFESPRHQGFKGLVEFGRVLDGVPKTQKICIDSSIPATIYVNKMRVGSTPFCGGIERGLTTKIVLKALGYEPMKVPLKKRIHPKILVSSTDFFASSKPSRKEATTFERISSNVTSTLSPVSGDFTLTSQGRWIEYSKDSYFVEFFPQSKTIKSLRKQTNAFEWQVRDFALKNFYEIKAGKAEYVNAMTKLSGLSEKEVEKIARDQKTPESFAKEITRASFE